jgi:sirohydrochlorin ferrochelatase
MRRTIVFFVALVFSFLTGWFLIDYLTVHPLRMSLMLLLTLSSFVLLLILLWRLGKKGMTWIYVLVSLAGFLAAYVLNARIFLNQDDPRFIPELTRTASDQVNGHTAVVYFTHGEPETYSPIGWLNQFKEFDEQGISFVPFVARPIFVYMLRNKYLEVGRSNHRQTHKEMLATLQGQYRSEGDSTTQFYLSFLDDEPRPDAAVIQALNEGAGKIIVSEVFLTVSNHTAEGQNLIREVEAEEKLGVELVFTDPLWDSDLLRSVFLEKVYAHMGDFPKDKVAIALVGHGQPDEWDVEWATETNQERDFRSEVLKLFEQDGFHSENLGSAWMEFKSPKPAELMEQFVQNRVTRVYYFSAAISADAIHSQADVPHLVHEYDFPEGVEAINLGAWNNHPTVIHAIKERIDEHMPPSEVALTLEP